MTEKYKLVPIEPTEEMIHAADSVVELELSEIKNLWSEMISAAPALPLTGKREAGSTIDDEIDDSQQRILAAAQYWAEKRVGTKTQRELMLLWQTLTNRINAELNYVWCITTNDVAVRTTNESVRNAALDGLTMDFTRKFFDEATVKRLFCTRWKDGIDIDEPTQGLIEFAKAVKALKSQPAQPIPPQLKVWYGSMPESNGKSNWTAMLYRADGSFMDGITIDRSEYPDRVRYEADRMRFLIGEITDEPDILKYDSELCSSLVEPAQPSITEILSDSLNTVLWLHRRIKPGYGTPPNVRGTINRLETAIGAATQVREGS